MHAKMTNARTFGLSSPTRPMYTASEPNDDHSAWRRMENSQNTKARYSPPFTVA